MHDFRSGSVYNECSGAQISILAQNSLKIDLCLFLKKSTKFWQQRLRCIPVVSERLGLKVAFFQISIAPVRCFIFSWVTRVFFKDNFRNFHNLHNNLFVLYFITKIASFVVFILQFFRIEQFFAIVFRYNVVFFHLNFFRKTFQSIMNALYLQFADLFICGFGIFFFFGFYLNCIFVNLYFYYFIARKWPWVAQKT